VGIFTFYFSLLTHRFPLTKKEAIIMKLAISISGNKLESPFDPRFGRAAAFCLVDSETGEWSSHENPALSASGGAGVQAAQFIAKLGAQAVISGAYGPKAFDTLSPADIEMYLAPTDETLTATNVLELFKAGKLSKTAAATHEGHHGAAN
jgi:predicted Fe-Mo cluster-binding NifX family protein